MEKPDAPALRNKMEGGKKYSAWSKEIYENCDERMLVNDLMEAESEVVG